MRSMLFATLCLTLLIAVGCQEEIPQAVNIPPQSVRNNSGNTKVTAPIVDQEITSAKEQIQAAIPEQPEQKQPKPPISEDFQGAPQLSLFPRVGDFRPADDSDRLPYWNTFIDHLVKVTGVAEDQASSSRAWVFRSIKSIDSLGYFSPLGVEPQTTYQVSFKLAAELSDGASAGIGILEFNKFLWIPDQYSEGTYKQHFRGAHEGKRLTGTTKDKHTFSFITGPETRMIHLVLFREGTHDRNNVMFDDIKIEEVKGER